MGRALARRLTRGSGAFLALLVVACVPPRSSSEPAPAPLAAEHGDGGPRDPSPPAGATDPVPAAAAAAPAAPAVETGGPAPAVDPPRQVTVEAIAVKGVGSVLVVPGAPEATGVALYLHGRCGDPEAFRAFVAAIPPSLTFMSVRGDVRCTNSARTRWSSHVPGVDQRLRRVVDAVSARRAAAGRAPLSDARWIVFGYSEGALRAEALLARYPDRYVAGILGGGPRAPRPGTLDRAGGVILLAGDRDARGHLQKAAADLAGRGLRVRFDLLPDARHGEYGPEAERVVGAGLRWLLDGPPFTEAGDALHN